MSWRWVSTAACALVALLAMEGWAALLHRRLWHRAWWPMHRSHHAPAGGYWQANDALSLLHAPPAAMLCIVGLKDLQAPWAPVTLGVGVGMSLFGLLYLLFHDGLVHQRLPLGRLGRARVLRAMVRAHHVHHHSGGPPYGFFLAPFFLARRRRRLGGAVGPTITSASSGRARH